MPSIYQIGRLGRTFAKKQVDLVTSATFAATDAIRHENAKLNFSHNRILSKERHAHPSTLDKWTRRITASWSLSGILYPSGTIGTAPDMDEIFECGFGQKTNISPLATTIASGPTTTGATLAAVTGLTVGQGIVINVTTGTPATGRVVRWIDSIVGSAVTWSPALPQAPAVGDTVKSGVNYSLATALPAALSIAHYMTSVSKEGQGCVVDQLSLMWDANDEVHWEASGPMRQRLSSAQAEPGAFTTVGNQPPSGLTGHARMGANALDFLKLRVTMNNAMELDNFNFGKSLAEQFFRKNKRSIEIEIGAMYTDDTQLMTIAENASDSNVVVAQCGQTEGKIIASYMPNVDLDVPDHPDGEETMELAFRGAAKGVAGNDEWRLFLG
jgi:hypothetical protein